MSYAYNLVHVSTDLPLINLSVYIYCQNECMSLVLSFEDNDVPQSYDILYSFNGNDTLLSAECETLLVQGKDYVDLLREDVREILLHATLSKQIEVGVEYYDGFDGNVNTAKLFYEQFKMCSREQEQLLDVHTLRIQVEHLSQICSILPCFNSNSLNELIVFIKASYQNPEIAEFCDIVKTDHWKKAKSVQIHGFLASIPLEHFWHFEEVSTQVLRVSAKTIQNLLKIDFNAPNFASFVMHYMYLENDVTEQLLDNLIGSKQTNQHGMQVRMIGEKREFYQGSDKIEIKSPDPVDSAMKTLPHAYDILHASIDLILTSITVYLDCDQKHVKLILAFHDYPQKFDMYYEDKGNDTTLLGNKQKLLFEGRDYVELFCEDLQKILEHGKFSKSIEIGIEYHNNSVGAANQVYERISICSQQNRKEIDVYHLRLQIENVSQLHPILPCFNAHTLKKLAINIYTDDESSTRLGFDNIISCNHWRNATHIYLNGFVAFVPFENLCHFEKVRFQVSRISVDDIRKLLKVDFDAPRFRKFTVCFKYLDDDVTEQLLDTLIGPKEINEYGNPVRLMGNDRAFFKDSEKICIEYSGSWDDAEDVLQKSHELFSNLSMSHCSTSCLCNSLIMENVAQYLSFFEFQILRKVSFGIRQCIDSLKLNPNLVAMKVFVEESGHINLEIFGRGGHRRIEYMPQELPNSTQQGLDWSATANDLIHNLKYQKSALKELFISFVTTEEYCETGEVSDGEKEMISSRSEDQRHWEALLNVFRENQLILMLKEIVNSLDRLLSVENLKVTTRNPNTVAHVLRNLDPVPLRKIEFGSSFGDTPNDAQSIKQLVSLAQWKNAEELKIKKLVVTCEVKHLTHFANVDFMSESISLQDVLYLKETFLSSSTFQKFKVKFKNSDVNDSIFEDDFLGNPELRVQDASQNRPNIWFFHYAGDSEDLQIRYYQNQKVFMFTRVPRQIR